MEAVLLYSQPKKIFVSLGLSKAAFNNIYTSSFTTSATIIGLPKV